MSSKILQLGSEKIQSKQSHSRRDWVWTMTASRSIDTEIILATDTRKLVGKNPLQYSFLENPHGQRSLEGYSPWDHKKSDTTEWLNTRQHSTGLKQEREYMKITSQLSIPKAMGLQTEPSLLQQPSCYLGESVKLVVSGPTSCEKGQFSQSNKSCKATPS